MKNIVLSLLVIIAALSNISCDDSVNPIVSGSGSEQYVLYCIINANSTVQLATVAKTYKPSGTDPYLYKDDPAIKGADIKIIYNTVSYQFKDTSITRTDTGRYTTPKAFYVTRGIKFKAGDSVKIKATLSNGVVLTSAIKIPASVNFTKSENIISTINDETGATNWSANWTTDLNQSLMYYPRMYIAYQKFDGSILKYYAEKEVPLRYMTVDGVYKAIYPGVTKVSSTAFEYEAIDSAMAQVAGNDDYKSNYRIINAVLRLMIMDENLSNYYSTTNGYLDDVTIRIDEADYTNIKGGLGLFGAYNIVSTSTFIDEDYIKSFGYFK
jgi:hypothetical protein